MDGTTAVAVPNTLEVAVELIGRLARDHDAGRRRPPAPKRRSVMIERKNPSSLERKNDGVSPCTVYDTAAPDDGEPDLAKRG
jgi:hypothetical protein